MQSEAILNLLVEKDSKGQAAFEEVLAEPLGAGNYRLARSPGFVQGIARGDVIALDPVDSSKFTVLSRGGMVAIQVLRKGDLDELNRFLSPRFIDLGGSWDGRSDSILVYSVPVGAGFEAIEKAIADAKQCFGSIEWYYGNVYDTRDGVTPLRWWE